MGFFYETDPLTLQKRSTQPYIVATAFLSLFGIVGFAYYGLPFFYDFMIKEYGWSRTVVTSGNALGKLVVGPLFGFIAGWLIDKYGPRRLMLSGVMMMGVALIGLSISDNLGMFYLFYIFNALGYVCGGPLPCQVLISRWFDKNRGKAMGIAYLGIGTGGALVPQIAAGLEKSIGWHNALASLGILIILFALPMVYFIKGASVKPAVQGKSEEAIPIKSILTNRNFYLLAFGSMCSIGAVGGVGQHLKLYLRDINFSQSDAANVMSFVLLSSLAGRLLMGWLADIFRRKYVMLMIYLIVASAIPLLLMPDFPGRIYIFAVIFGVGLGGDYMIIPLMAGDLFGIRALGRTMGIILVADGVAESMFPMLVGRLYDTASSYTPGFMVLIFVALAGAVIISFLPKQQIAHSR
ncbi:MAG: MFS transporter [Bacteroidetes bacterium GWE2_41_25]|nr:MAG: MFS transporter [Bacteroidetes bacterium GWA2_40_15]OFX91642.1 MAG: MFS transporter [Bacteroidetes bacterium GWE2_41_25]OFX92905.1 MAG: MFS transporter [Bacteroidetes bacterium GWC2_40_22]OFY59629.1 MAG: MFS transporter [Bacteroidetes bacterium GWF2_41_9]HAM10609.1 MFS transporter [Bacteroidales bacterium]